MTTWTYTGDMDIEHGGMWLDLEEYRKAGDYCPCVKVTPLDSAIGFEGAFMIETGPIYMPEKHRQSALDTCGYAEKDIEENPILLIEAYDAYMGLDGPMVHTIQTIEGGLMEFEGWKADQIVILSPKENLKDYIFDNYVL